MYNYKFDGYHSYTSYTSLTASEEAAIAKSNKPLPFFIVVNGEKINWREEYNWSENRTKAGYVTIKHGIKIKYVSSASPDYRKEHGHGSCTMLMIIKSPVELKFEYYSE